MRISQGPGKVSEYSLAHQAGAATSGVDCGLERWGPGVGEALLASLSVSQRDLRTTRLRRGDQIGLDRDVGSGGLKRGEEFGSSACWSAAKSLVIVIRQFRSETYVGPGETGERHERPRRDHQDHGGLSV